MAQRRMFSKKITDTDKFMAMPDSAKILYFYLNMNADDDGFIGNPKTIQRMIGSNDDDMTLLIAKQYIIPFDSGVIVIKDWKIHNYIRNDRYSETVFLDEKKQLSTDKSNAYSIVGIPNGYQMDTQDRLGKDRLGKDRLAEDSKIPSAEISDFYQQEIGILSPSQFEQLIDYINLDSMEVEVIKKAITKSADNGKRTFSYINSILRNWKNNGIKTIVQVEEEQRQFESKKQTGMTDKEREDLKQPDEFYGF